MNSREGQGPEMLSARKVLLEARNLVKEFPVGGTRRNPQVVHAVTDVNLKIYEGETLALVRRIRLWEKHPGAGINPPVGAYRRGYSI